MKLKTIFGLLMLTFFVFVSPSAAQDRKAVSGAEVTGTFTRKNGEFKILALGKGRLKIEFNGSYEYKMENGEMMANVGEASGEAVIEGDTAIFKPEEFADTCTITLKFTRPGTLAVTEAGDSCGFGHNVTSGGTYRKKSKLKPKFTASL